MIDSALISTDFYGTIFRPNEPDSFYAEQIDFAMTAPLPFFGSEEAMNDAFGGQCEDFVLLVFGCIDSVLED